MCNSDVDTFNPGVFPSELFEKHHIIGGGYRENCICPNCNSMDRERWLFYILKNKTDIMNLNGRVLHFAPEPPVDKLLKIIYLMKLYQDYDLVLRIVPNVKVSFTNKVLLEAYRQKDSISNNNDNLKKTIEIISSKDYKYDDEQRKKLNGWLLKILIDAKDFKYNTDINNLDVEKDKIINFKNEELIKNNQECEEVLNRYNSIVNSKRWKIIDKMCKMIGKK